MFRASSVPIIRSYQLYTWQLVRFMQVMWPFLPDSPRKRPHNLHETYQLPSVQLITPDDWHRRCPKHVEFHEKINFGYLLHLFGYLYEAYHDSRSLEHKKINAVCFWEVMPCSLVHEYAIRSMWIEHLFWNMYCLPHYTEFYPKRL